MKQWDIFISHASEDKEVVALPLAKALRKAGLKVWLDKHELRVGDSLREKIDEGLAQSSFGIVVLSENFLAKDWPKRELDGLFAREESGHKVILPVWHKIDKKSLSQYSPMLASRLAADTSQGIAQVSADIIDAIFYPRGDSASNLSPNIGRRFINLLDNNPEKAEVRDFLAAHPAIIRKALGLYDDAPLRLSPVFSDFSPDFCVGLEQFSIRSIDWNIVVLDTPSTRLFLNSVVPVPSLAKLISQLESLRQWVISNLEQARVILRDIQPDFQGVVVAGRRSQLTMEEIDYLKEYNDSLFGIRIRTYDWLIDAATSLD
ncbi:MAG: toll/interleukin-1 receptor domain-containing protein [Acidobacteriota bacterium]|nr:toll/interleukin-1 receptor domain-containing protein [Acidobacteriota bacterium]